MSECSLRTFLSPLCAKCVITKQLYILVQYRVNKTVRSLLSALPESKLRDFFFFFILYLNYSFDKRRSSKIMN